MRFQLLLFLVCTLMFAGAYAGNDVTIKTVVIDAGHGGKDPGATGPGKNNEKDIALAVALKLGEYIKKNFPEVNIIYTRQTDVFLELHERAEIANKNKADLFIAIHCNSSTSPQVYGTSTYVLGLHRTEANLEVAKRENSVILMEGDRDKNYEFDPNSPEGNIIMSMKQNAFLDQSIDIASKIENQFETLAHRKSLGVKQAGFYVLYKTTMPSLLSEIGFVSNPDEERFLTSAKGQDLIANGLFKAFKEYKFEMENREGEAPVANETKKPAEPAAIKSSGNIHASSGGGDNTKTTAKKPDVKESAPAPVQNTQAEVAEDPSVVTTTSGRKIRKPIENSSGGGVSPDHPAAKPAPKPEAPPPPKVVVENKPVKTQVIDSVKTAVMPVKKTVAQDTSKPITNKPLPVTNKTEAKVDAVAVKTNVDTIAVAVKEPKAIVHKPVVDSSTIVMAEKKHIDEPNIKAKEIVAEKKPENKPAPAPTKNEPKAEIKTTAPVKIAAEKPAPIVKEPVKEPKIAPAKPKDIQEHATESGIVFKVQLFALKVPLKNSEHDKVLKIFHVVSSQVLANGITRYYAGDTKSFEAAKKLQNEAVNQGYRDAFIVGFRNGERISAAEMKTFEN